MTPKRAHTRRRHLACLLGAVCICGLAPAATPAAAADAPATPLDFGAFFQRPVGPRGLQPSAALQAAAGHRVQLRGYMVVREDPEPGRFQLAPLPLRLAEHADGDASDLPPSTVTVLLPASQRERIVAPHPGPLVLQGRLEYGRQEDAQGRVSWLRLLLDDDALAPAAEQATAAAAPR